MSISAPLVAFGLLTTLPVPAAGSASRLGAAVAYFPVVGLALGVATAALDTILLIALPLPLVAVVDIAFLALASGGLHLDGVADAADGLFAGPDTASRLAAMRDSRIGAFGAAALSLVLLLEFSILSAPRTDRVATIVTAVILSRAAMALAAGLFPAAREDGLAASVRASVRARDVAIAGGLAGLLAGTLAPAPVLALAVVLGVVATVAALALSRTGGLTGDVYGAIGEISFALVLCLS